VIASSGRGALAFVFALSAGCASPEAIRSRGGGPGADVGNRRPIVEFHAGAKPYFQTRCVQEVECQGPLPVFRPASPAD
jgi:hypothetical protein